MKSYRHPPPAPPADQDRAWDRVVAALRPGPAPTSDDDLPDADDLPDDPDGHLVYGVDE